jgi:hypothetical protein
MAEDTRATMNKARRTNPKVANWTLLQKAGLGYGLSVGLLYCLFTWGYDLLANPNQPFLPASLKFLTGALLTLAISGLTGFLVSFSSNTFLPVLPWLFTGFLIGQVTGRISFMANDLTMWIFEPGFRDAITWHMDYSASVRTGIVSGLFAFIGMMIGLVEPLALDWAWDRSGDERNLGKGGWEVILFVAGVFSLCMAFSYNNLINLPLRKHQKLVARYVHSIQKGNIDSEDSNFRALLPQKEELADPFTVHFVSFDSTDPTWYMAHVDLLFDNGFLLRCTTAGVKILFCYEYSGRYNDWMHELLKLGLTIPNTTGRIEKNDLVVDDAVYEWLERNAELFGGEYQLARRSVLNGQIIMNARFENGFEMECLFQGASPVFLSLCDVVEYPGDG